MFFYCTIPHEVVLEPQYFGRNLYKMIKTILYREVEGACLGEIGWVVLVTECKDEDIVPGLIEADTGKVAFTVNYRAILFRPYKNEVLDVRVVEVNEMGFYTTAGPCRIFVSRHAMPPDISGEGTGGYDDEEDAWISDDREVVIKRDSIVRLKILGEQVDLNEITAVGTIKEDYLGLISSEPLA